jgi:hypothetical protein
MMQVIGGGFHIQMKPRSWRRGQFQIWIAVATAGLILPGNALEANLPGKVLRRLIAPFRSSPFLQTSTVGCDIGTANCGRSFLPELMPVKFGRAPMVEDPERLVTMERRTLRRGPFCHRWLQLETSHGSVTLGYGPATVPLIDAGEIGVRDQYGNYKMLSGMHPLPMLAMPPVNYHYAKAPGRGRPVGKPIQLTAAQADAVVQKELNHRFVIPYIPIFHDCRTYLCKVEASAQGKSSLPCYLLFKGYW